MQSWNEAQSRFKGLLNDSTALDLLDHYTVSLEE